MTQRSFVVPDWVPKVADGARILVIGASGGVGQALVHLLLRGSDCVVGFHFASCDPTEDLSEFQSRVISLQATLEDAAACEMVVRRFVEAAGGLDGLVVLCGAIARNAHWLEQQEEEWRSDMRINLDIPFFLSRAAMKAMEPAGGAIVLNGTESALHGGSPYSFAYGVAKRGVECLVQGLAREGAPRGVLVNGVRLGFIRSGFHERWQNKSQEDIERRVQMIPLKRAGEPEEAAALIAYLLSGWAKFITGQMFALTGGDWL